MQENETKGNHNKLAGSIALTTCNALADMAKKN